MIWRTDKPTEDIILAQLSESFSGSRYVLLGLCHTPYEHYHEDGEEVPFSAIEKWASLKDNQNTDPVEEIKAYWESISKPDRQLGTAAKIDIKQFIAIISHFAQWQKEKMMEDAIEGEVECDCELHDAWIYLQGNKPNLQHGDKVKAIIIKE